MVLSDRANPQNSDVWIVLEKNWKDFYWLTGETPETLRILVQRMSTRFRYVRQMGRRSALDFPNKVTGSEVVNTFSEIICMVTITLTFYSDIDDLDMAAQISNNDAVSITI